MVFHAPAARFAVAAGDRRLPTASRPTMAIIVALMAMLMMSTLGAALVLTTSSEALIAANSVTRRKVCM